MELNISYRYEAKNDDSYNKLAAYAAGIVANVTLYPTLLTIIIDGNAAKGVGKFIDDNGLDFFIAPIEVDDDNLSDIINTETIDANTLRTVIHRLIDSSVTDRTQADNVIKEITKNCESLKKERDAARKDADMYQRWYSNEFHKADRIKSQVQAIAVLIDSIFPKE